MLIRSEIISSEVLTVLGFAWKARCDSIIFTNSWENRHSTVQGSSPGLPKTGGSRFPVTFLPEPRVSWRRLSPIWANFPELSNLVKTFYQSARGFKPESKTPVRSITLNIDVVREPEGFPSAEGRNTLTPANCVMPSSPVRGSVGSSGLKPSPRWTPKIIGFSPLNGTAN
ncbi:MAG: hypothetical protein Ct9H90mP8_0650 [Pseudomonadota bacterium]|nr:MAG: hypothetical protein Ct9H90mP8_0650 [Pseudomonadota bacterium]